MSAPSNQNYPHAMPAAATRRTTTRAALIVVVAFVALIAVACSSSDGADAADTGPSVDSGDATDAASGVEATLPGGVIYVTTRDGDLVVVDPEAATTVELWDGDAETLSPVIEVAGIDRSSGLHVLLNDRERQLDSSLTELEGSQLSPIVADFVTPFMLCLDPHPRAEMSMGHLLGLGTADPAGAGTTFEAVAFQGVERIDIAASDLPERPSIVCPRWTSERDTVATAAPPDGDATTVAIYIDGAAGPHEIVREGCALTPAGFAPDDQSLAVAATCYGDRWSDSGLYLVSLNGLDEVADLSGSGVIRLVRDNFGRAAWHPDGDWLVASRVQVVEGQTPDSGLADAPGDLVLVHPELGSVIEIALDDGDSPHSLAWLSTAVHG